MASDHQTNITQFFNTVSGLKPRARSSKHQLLNLEPNSIVDHQNATIKDGEVCSKRTNTTTPKRTASTATIKTPTSKKRKTTVTKKSQKTTTTTTKTLTDSKLVKRGRCLIDYGPVGAIRKLDFEDCAKNDDNNNNNDHVESKTFEDFLKAHHTEKSNKDGDSVKQTDQNNNGSIEMEAIKTRLRKCKNLSKLKEQLATINGCADKVKQFKEMKIHFQQPQSPAKSSPSKKLFGSPLRSSPQILIANSSPIKLPTRNLFGSPKAPKKKIEHHAEDLVLPKRFQNLVELFKLIDYNSWRMWKRQEACTFDKLKQIVESATHRAFTLDQLLKILTVQKHQPRFNLAWQFYSGQFSLTVMPRYDEQSVKCLNSLGNLLEREKEFHQSLLEIVKTEHLKFLSQMNLTLGDDDRIYRWHPMFKLDSVPDVEPDSSLLPKKPPVRIKKATILDYFGAGDPTVEKQNEPKCDSSSSSSKNEPSSSITPETSKIKSGLLKGISSDILKKVRAKEAARLAQSMRRPPEKELEIRTLAKLVDVSRIIYDCFLGSKRRSIAMDELIKRIADSVPMSETESGRHLDYLCSFELDQVGTKWIKMIPLKNNSYLQIDQTYPLANLYAALRKRMQQLQES